jgi:hypothetical protein
MAPAFYLRGTKMIVSHPLGLEFLKWINDQEGIVSIKAATSVLVALATFKFKQSQIKRDSFDPIFHVKL